MLIKEDHERLVKELYRPRDEYGWEVNIVRMEEMSRAEQIQIAPQSARDVDLARARSFTSPDTPQNLYPEGFQGNFIPVDAAAVGRLCVDRLTLSFEKDD
ncbi:hypothetical protein C8R47DRAFT_1329437 [Mycena vitilis]|nr:hypothetical protein C8R47DRAFT_1329437 [Mycena vitilis]